MSDTVRSYAPGGATVIQSDADRRVRASRGLRTLEHDATEIRKVHEPGVLPTSALPKNSGMSAIPVPPASSRAPGAYVSASPSPAAARTTPTQSRTNYTAELERLAQKYIPEKRPVGVPLTTAVKSSPPPGAIRSFETNKAFNAELHRAPVQGAPTQSSVREMSPSVASSSGPIHSPATTPEPEKKTDVVEQKEPSPEVGAPPTTQTTTQDTPPVDTSAPPAQEVEITAERDAPQEPEKREPELTAQDIAAELEEVLKKNKEERDDAGTGALTSTSLSAKSTKDPFQKPRRSSVKELEATLSSITLRIQSSASRIETYKSEARRTEKTLKDLYDKRDVINKNLEPIQEKERDVLAAIKDLEEKERVATNKIEKRDAETKRWEKEAERRELEDERWRLEEIFEKLRKVLERVERDRDSIQKKLEEEEKHKTELEAEERVTQMHRSLIVKESELEKAQKDRKNIEGHITNLKEMLRSIRTEEEKLENKKRELEMKSEVLSDTASKRSLERERRKVEDDLHAVEEKRWSREDELKKLYSEKDERDHVISLLVAECDSLRNSFEELEKGKTT